MKKILLFIFLWPVFFSNAQYLSSPQTLDGTITAAEYGNYSNIGTNGWYVAWDDTYLYFGKTGGSTGQPVIIGLDIDPISPVDGGTNSNGNLTNKNHFNHTTTAPFRIDVSVYWTEGYIEYWKRDGSGGYTVQNAATNILERANSVSNRECKIAWANLPGLSGRPASFNWYGYAFAPNDGCSASSDFIYDIFPKNGIGSTGINNTSGCVSGTTPRFYFYNSVVTTASSGTTNPMSTSFVSFETRAAYNYTNSSTLHPTTLYDITTNNSTLTVSNSISLAGNLVLSGTSAQVALGSNNITLLSTSTRTARVSNLTGVTTPFTYSTGKFNIQRYIPAKRAWRLLTAPLRGNGAGVSIQSAWQNGGGTATPGVGVELWNGTLTPGNGFIAGGAAPNIRKYIAGTGWSALSSTITNNIIENDPGNTTAANNTYAVYVTGDYGGGNITGTTVATTLSTPGKIVAGQQDFTVSSTNGHFNLIGNPYPSPIDLDLFSPANTFVSSTFYVYDPQIGTNGSYSTVLRTGAGAFTYTPDNSVAYRYIQSGQGFFATSNGSGPSVSFQESHKVSNTITTVFRPGNGSIEKLGVNISFQNPDSSWQLADGVAAIYDNSYSTAVTDEFDALKFTNPNETVSLIRNGKNMAIEARPLIDTYDTAFMNLAQMRAYTYKFDFMPSNMQAAGLGAFLQDAYTNTESAISLSANSAYQFVVNTDAGSFAANRFRIVYRPIVPLPVNFNGIKAYQKQNSIQVEWTVSNEINISKYEVEKSVN